MASKVLKSFLIGIGYDTKALEVGDRKINASLNGIKSNALGVSAALVGAFGAGAGLILSTANSIDRLDASTQNLRASKSAIYNFGNAVKLMGGQANEGADALKRFEEIQNNIRLKGTDSSLDDLTLAGIDTRPIVASALSGGNGMDLVMEIARQLPGLDEGKQAQVQNTLSTGDYAFRALKEGPSQISELMKEAEGYTGSIDQMTESSRELAKSTAALNLRFQGLTNEGTEKFMKSLIGASEAANSFLKEYRPEISKTIDALAENPQATAGIGVGAATAVTGAAISKLGFGGTGAALKGAGQIGMAISLADLMTPYIEPMFDKLFGVDRATPEVYSGQIERSPEAIDYLDHRDRSASDSMPPTGSSRDEDIRASAQAIGDVLSRTPIKVNNTQSFNFELDGQKLDARIIQVNERQNYEAAEDFKPTTER